MTQLRRRTVLAALVLLAATSARAQVPVGREILVTADPPSSELNGPARVAWQPPDGGFVVVWPTNIAGGRDVNARRFSAAGIPVGSQFMVNSFTTGVQNHPAIASDLAGHFVVVWESDQSGYGVGVFGQRFDASGARLGAEFRVTPLGLGLHTDPSVSSWVGGFVVAWTASPGNDIFARRYDAAGAPIGAEFQVNTQTTGNALGPTVAVDGSGNLVVVWNGNDPTGTRIRGQLFDPGGLPLGAEFLVDAGTAQVGESRVSRGSLGSFVVAWASGNTVGAGDIVARRFAPNGAPQGGEILVNAFTTGRQGNPDVAVDSDGDCVVVWDSEDQDGDWQGVFGRRFASTGAAGPEFMVNTFTTSNQWYPAVATEGTGNFIVTWHGLPRSVEAQRFAGGLMGIDLAVDASAGPGSDGNRVLEAGETVTVAPSWLNADFVPQTFTGTLSNFTGPGAPDNPVYSVLDPVATYGTVATGATGSCNADCYGLAISVPTTRPALHWDATFRETLAPASLVADKLWPLHVGESFADVPRTNGFYRFVETLLHHGVTGGCAATTYCPGAPTTREQMAVFVLVAKEGSGYVPLPTCVAPPFSDVPVSSPFCSWIADLKRRRVVSGCGGSSYCPTAPVSRQEMAVFILATKEPGVTPPACGTSVFNDVPASSPFCPWIEELARRGVVGGCGGGAYCPTAPVTREQMGVFLSVTFGLLLYGP